MNERKTHRGDDGLLYDDEGFLVYTGPSPLDEGDAPDED